MNQQETATRAPVDLTLHIEFSSTLSFVARCCAREAGSLNWGKNNTQQLVSIGHGSGPKTLRSPSVAWGFPPGGGLVNCDDDSCLFFLGRRPYPLVS